MDKLLLIIGIAIVIAILVTGGFGLFSQVFDGDGAPGGGFSFFSSGPRADGPGGVVDSDIVGITPESSNGNGQSGNTTAPKNPKAAITISSVSRPGSGATDPTNEYILLRHTGASDAPAVSVSGWSVANSQGRRFALGGAQRIPFFSSAEAILLRPGQELYIHSAAGPFGQNFQESACTGYLNQSYRFNPSLSESCPRPDFRRFLNFKDACIQFLESRVSGCRAPTITSEEAIRIGNECIEYVSENFNYAGCVKNYRTATDFYRGRWHLYLARPEKLWRDVHDRITLSDETGVVIDTYEY